MALPNGLHDIAPGKMAVVVTYLEMTAPAATRPIALPDGLTFRQIETPDLASYRDLFRRVGSNDWLWYSRLTLSDDALSDTLNDPQVALYTLTRDGLDEAMLELDFRTTGACELAYFGLTSALIGTGAGRYLMNEAITRAWAKPITRFHVHTCTADSPQALAFYQRSGFVPYKRQVEVDDDPRQNGVLDAGSAGWFPVL
jgi:GNAT superfamily N-acetyltransferase